jgi:predicted HTH domain antitoxin
MKQLSIPYSEDLLVSSGQSRESLEEELRLLLAVKLFELGRVSLGKAAKIAGLRKLRFMDELARLRIPVINLDDDQIQDELHDGE